MDIFESLELRQAAIYYFWISEIHPLVLGN